MINIENITIGKNCSISKDVTIGYKENGKGKIIIGNNVRIDMDVVLRTCGGIITIMDNVTMGMGAIIFAGGNVQIKENTLISPRVQMYAQNHGIYKEELIRKQKQDMYGIWVSEDCWIGAGSILTDRSFMAPGCVLGAGSILTKNMKIANEVWAGNPAKFIKKRLVLKDDSFGYNVINVSKYDMAKEQKTPVKCPEPLVPPKSRILSYLGEK